MNDVRIINYTLIAALFLILATYTASMINMTRMNHEEGYYYYNMTALRL